MRTASWQAGKTMGAITNLCQALQQVHAWTADTLVTSSRAARWEAYSVCEECNLASDPGQLGMM